MDAKQFAWTYMVLNGKANKCHSFYGGYDIVDKKISGGKKLAWYDVDYNESFIKMIKDVGVDWRKTYPPTNESESVFNGTFDDNGSKEVLTGELVMKNGYVQHWIAEPLTCGVFEAMAKIDEFRAKYYEIFGGE